MAETEKAVAELTEDEPGGTEERVLSRWVHDRWEEADQAVRQDGQLESWDAWIEAYWGAPPPDAAPSFRPPILCNVARSEILQEASELTDMDPRVFLSSEGQPNPKLQGVEKAIQAYWRSRRVNMALLDSVIWSFILPCGYMAVSWDPTLEGGRGDLIWTAPDPRCIRPDPDCVNDTSWAYVLKEDWLDLFTVRQMWPDTGGRVKSEEPRPEAGRDVPIPKTMSYQGPLSGGPGQRSISRLEGKGRVRVVTCVVKDPATKEEGETVKDPDTGETVKVHLRTLPKFPRGRIIQVAGDVVLHDDAWIFRHFPVFRVIAQPAPGTFWPASAIRDMLPIQQAVDKLRSNLVESGVRLNNGIAWGTEGCGMDPETFAGIPGQAMLGRPGSEFKVIYPNAMPADMFQLPEKLEEMIRKQIGRGSQVRQGATGRGNVSAELTETEISQASAITRLRARLLYDTIQRMAELTVDMLSRLYTTRRHLAYVDGGTMQSVPWDPIPEIDRDRLTAHVDPSSLKPMSETMVKRLVLLLLKMGKVGPRYGLKTLELPDVDEAMRETEQMNFLAAMAGMLRKGGKKK